ncbi:MAG: ATP-binding protein, partial [Mangrovicoccus sp.]
IGSTTGTPGYFLSELIADARGQPLGVITVKISFAELENSWQTAQEPVFLANSDGVILLASDPDWRYHSLAPLTGEQRARIAADQQFRDEPLLALSVDKGLNLTDEDAPLHLVSKDLPHGWSLHYIPNDDRATNRALLFTAMVVGLVGLLAYVALFRRARRIRAALGRSEREEAQLRQANEALAVEIAERQRAEDQLRHAQTELEQTSRLAALGQLAASVTHELGQPIAAMRNHLAAAEFRPPDLGEFTHRLNGLVDRMEGITRQLKFFATPDMDPFETVDLRDVLAGSLALLHHNIAAQGAELTMSQDDRPMELRGSRLRLEQVITNLLRNALDACEDCDPPKIQIELGQSAHSIWIEIRDNGHGLGEAS